MLPSPPATLRARPGLGVWLWVLALVGSAGHAPASQERLRAAPAESSLPSGGADLPVTWWCDYPLVSVLIEGRGPFTFLLDTGAAVCVVDLDLAEALPGPLTPTRRRALGARGETVPTAGVLALGEVRVGEWVLEGLDALALDLEPASEALRTELDGVLGYPAFEGLLLELDYPGQAVRVRRGRLPEADGREILELLPGPIPRLALSLGSEYLAATLDSGSGGGLDLPYWPQGVELLRGPVDDLGVLTVGGLGPPRPMARLALDLQLGRHRVGQPIASSTGGEARLGARLMRHFRWTFDPAEDRVRIERADSRAIAVEPLRSSGLALALRRGHLVVLGVLPASPAERAGVRAGDRILSLAGRAAADLAACTDLRDLLDGIPVLVAELERAGERFERRWNVLVLVP